ncbi:transporter [Phenylobacterium sp.]|uniref:transporter n=1 Tax=Phenylobacterium sp. TaxID=1871053 RepID=UPI0025D8A380|nr:transporter [Phenylobacterium sp.]
MRVRVGAVAVLGAALLSAGAAHAAPRREFCPDRPGKGSPPCVVDPGVLQLELSGLDAAFQRSGPGATDTYSVGAMEWRLGLTPTLEGQVQWAPYTQVRTRGEDATRVEGVGDLVLLLRRSLRNPDGSGLSIALEPFVSAPTATRGLGSGGWQGGLVVPFSVPISDDVTLSLAPEVDVNRDSDGAGVHPAWTMAAGLSRTFGPVSLGAELWGSIDDDPAERAHRASLDLTLAWTPPRHEDLQLDVGVYGGLTRDTPDLEVLVGLSRRF